MARTRPYQDKDWLFERYATENLTMAEIADECGVSAATIHSWIHRHDIPARADRPRGRRTAAFRTQSNGYEAWHDKIDGTQHHVLTHRLAAVAWFGLDDVAGHDIHHKNGIPWDNRESNLTLLTRSDHLSKHAVARRRNDSGQFTNEYEP